jgi:hypothetical protein
VMLTMMHTTSTNAVHHCQCVSIWVPGENLGKAGLAAAPTCLARAASSLSFALTRLACALWCRGASSGRAVS